MAESTDHTQAKSRLTTPQWILIAAGVVVVVAVVVVLIRAFLMGTEPPIRVRNGSMDILLYSGKWVEDGDGWSPSLGKSPNDFAVTVVSANGYTCKDGQSGTGKMITIYYRTFTGPDVQFTLQASQSANPKTKVRPKDKLTRVNDLLLRYGTPGDTSWISGVEVSGGGPKWRCDLGASNQLSVINICPASNPVCWKAP